MNKYTVMPLLNSSFEPGKAREIVAGFEDMDVRNIAQAELFYFMGEAESSSEIAERYLTSEIMELRLSASMIYGYSNMTLGNLVAVQRGLEEIQECLKLAMRKKVSEETLAVCVFARYAGAVLLHLPTDGIPSLWKYSSKLPEGVRLFAVYVMAHHSYLNGEYWSAYGLCQAALAMTREVYPVSMIYIQCMLAMCSINRKCIEDAREELMKGWNLAEKDNFIEPFIEHHGLLRGLLEACIRKSNPDMYRRITEGVLSFSRSWVSIHNPQTKGKVTNELSTMEFSIAMLAGEGWSNKEISAYLGIAVNTVKHYLTDIFSKLNVNKRSELKDYMLK